MVFFYGDAYWVSRKLENIASSHVGAVWIVNLCRKGTCNATITCARQDDYLAIC